MALTLSELESAYTLLSTRLSQIERLLKTAVSHKQMTELTLVLEKNDIDSAAEIESLKDRVTTLETTVAEIV